MLKAVRLDKFGMYALKSMDVHSQEKRHQLVKELTTFASLGRGPNIVKFHGAYYNAGRAMLVLEYMNRGSLMSVVEECGPLPPDVVAHFAKQIFFGLEYIHQRRFAMRRCIFLWPRCVTSLQARASGHQARQHPRFEKGARQADRLWPGRNAARVPIMPDRVHRDAGLHVARET